MSETIIAKKLDHAPRGRHVHSTDKRKKLIMAEFKRLVPGTYRVSLLRESAPGVFQAHCLPRNEDRPDALSHNYELELPALEHISQERVAR